MLMRFVLPLTLLTTAACGSKKDEPPPAPFSGPLTVDRIMGAKDVVKLLEPWNKALPKLEAKLGKATMVDDKKGDHYWAVMDGDKCAYVMYSSGDGKEFQKEGLVVDMSQAPMTVDKDGPIMNRADCLEAAGQAGVKEDPNAPAPPADGVVTPADFKQHALAGKSKWEGKRIKITGTVKSTGGLLVDVDDVDCILKDNASADLVGQTVTAEGTVKIKTMVSGTGEPSYEAELADCTVTPADGAAPTDGSAGSAAAGSAAK